MKNVDGRLWLLFALTIFLIFALFFSEIEFPNDGQIFQVVATLLSGASGILLMALRKELGVNDTGQPTATTVETRVTSVTLGISGSARCTSRSVTRRRARR